MSDILFSTKSGVTDSFFGKSQEPIKMILENEYEACERMSAIPKLFKSVKSENFAEKFTGKTSLSNFEPVGEGGNYPKTSIQEGYSKVIEPVTWKQSFAVTAEMVEDKKNIEISGEACGFVQSFARTKEMFAANLFKNATQTSMNLGGKSVNIACADGKAVFAKDHPSKVKGASQSNLFADVFSVDALSAMECAMQNFKDDNGNILSICPDTILIPNDYKIKSDVFAAIGADKDPNTANNGFNYQFGRWNVVVWNYLGTISGAASGTSPYVLLDSKYNESRGGAIWVDRLPLSVTSYVDNNNDNNIWNGRARFSANFNNWRAFAVGGMTGGTELL